MKLSLNLFTSQYTEGERFTRTMPARIIVITITVFAFIAGSSLEVLRANINKSVWCLRACGLEKDKTLSERVQVLKSFSCYRCRKRSRRDIGVLTAKTSAKRRKRSFSIDDCGNTASNGTLFPKQQFTSRPKVTFGQYEKTANWYANVSWDPIKDPDGVLKGYKVMLDLGSDPSILCSVLPKNQTSLSINISHYGYTYPDLINLLIQSIPSNVTASAMQRYFNDVRIATSTQTTIAKTTASKEPTRETTKKGTNKTIQYVSIFVGLAVGILLVIVAVVVLRKIFLWRQMRYQPESDEDETKIISDDEGLD